MSAASKHDSNIPGWVRVIGAGRSYCNFCRALVYWKKQARTVDPYGNVIHAPPCEARLSGDVLEYRDVPHRCKR